MNKKKDSFDFKGIIPVLQTPFKIDRSIDYESYEKLIEVAIADGASAFLVPVVASEVGFLKIPEREELVRTVIRSGRGRVGVVVGASSSDPKECQHFARFSEEVGADAYLIAVPGDLYKKENRHLITPYFKEAAKIATATPLILQDFELDGTGLSIEETLQLCEDIPQIEGIKIETNPAKEKALGLRKKLGNDFYLGGGWAFRNPLQAFDHKVNGIHPESAMIIGYSALYHLHRSGRRDEAEEILKRMAQVLLFSNRNLYHSVLFFKRLLIAKDIFKTDTLRGPCPNWNAEEEIECEQMIQLYLKTEASIKQGAPLPEIQE